MTDVKSVTLRSGFEMPLVGFGTWQLSGRTAQEATLAALNTGYRHIDTATIYRNEADVGRAVRNSGIPREEIFITTKLPPDRHGSERETLQASLKSLGTDYVDLWLIHWPPRAGLSSALWQALMQARDEGLARSIGVSNYSIAQIDALDEVPAVNQIPWSPSDHDPAIVAEHQRRDVVLEGYSALKRTNLRDRVLAEIATRHGVTPVQVLLRWHLEHRIVVIPKSQSPQRIAANFDLYGFSLSPDEVARIDGLSRQ